MKISKWSEWNPEKYKDFENESEKKGHRDFDWQYQGKQMPL